MFCHEDRQALVWRPQTQVASNIVAEAAAAGTGQASSLALEAEAAPCLCLSWEGRLLGNQGREILDSAPLSLISHYTGLRPLGPTQAWLLLGPVCGKDVGFGLERAECPGPGFSDCLERLPAQGHERMFAEHLGALGWVLCVAELSDTVHSSEDVVLGPSVSRRRN